VTNMADPMRAERVALRDGRTVTIRTARMADAESLLRNANLVGAEAVYILLDHLEDIETERRWLEGFDGVRNVLFVADAAGEVVGSADCHGGGYAKTQHVGGVGIAIRDGWREVGLGRILMNRILEWMRARGFKKADLCVFASNMRARRLYESLGFNEEGLRRRQVRIRDVYEDEVVMGLWLEG
jgi:ribosomal protein S18 acetylase RimI-like enzyme